MVRALRNSDMFFFCRRYRSPCMCQPATKGGGGTREIQVNWTLFTVKLMKNQTETGYILENEFLCSLLFHLTRYI